MRTIVIATAVLALAAGATDASSTAAWSKLNRDAKLKCMQMTHFNNARASEPVIFSDRNAQVAILVTGIFPQPALKGGTGSNLCLYDRKTKTAEVQEAMGWHGR